MKQCLECRQEFKPYDKRAKFCSSSCAAKKNNRERERKVRPGCDFCGKEIKRSGVKYCSQTCSSKHLSKKIIDKWKKDPVSANTKHGVSRSVVLYLKEQAGWKCQSPNCCVPGGWSEVHPVTGSVPVEIDHIDGDAYNNHPDNLIVLCPNCHALTANYRALNKNSGRTYRSDYNQYEKK